MKAKIRESFAGVRLGFRFSTELQTAARTERNRGKPGDRRRRGVILTLFVARKRYQT